MAVANRTNQSFLSDFLANRTESQCHTSRLLLGVLSHERTFTQQTNSFGGWNSE